MCRNPLIPTFHSSIQHSPSSDLPNSRPRCIHGASTTSRAIGFSTRRPDHALSRPRALDKSNRVVFRLGGIRHSRDRFVHTSSVVVVAYMLDLVTCGRSKLDDPILMRWALRRYQNAVSCGSQNCQSMEQTWFHDLALRRWIDTDHHEILEALFRILPARLFRNLQPTIIARWGEWTGKLLWRKYTIPAPGEPGSETWPKGDQWKTGGGSVWVTGVFDPETNLTFWGTGNGGPWMGDQRPGDNLYTSSVMALDQAEPGGAPGS